MRVVCRVRPLLPSENEDGIAVAVSKDSGEVTLIKGQATKFKFDSVYDSKSTQEDLYQEVRCGVEKVVAGFNTCIFAYGITSAGKTFTMQGSSSAPGIIPRVAKELFNVVAENRSDEWTVQVSYLELYNERLIDLFNTNNASKDTELTIREDIQRTITVPGLTQRVVRSVDEFQQLYAEGCNNRKTAATFLNVASSRSHAIVTLYLTRRSADRILTGKLHLVDLAGSEDNRQTNNKGARLTESANINASLFALSQVVEALQKKMQWVPYRNSKLTRLLQDSLGGSAYGIIIANVAPASSKAHETLRTLHFASKSREIVNTPVQHQTALPPPPPPPVIVAAQPKRAALQQLGAPVRAVSSSSSTQASSAAFNTANLLLRNKGGDIEQRLAEKRAAKKFSGSSSAAAENLPANMSSSSPAFITPVTRSIASEQIMERARELEMAGDFHKALQIYRGALHLIGEDDCRQVAVRERIEALERRMEKEKNEDDRIINGKDDGIDDDNDEEYDPESEAKKKKGSKRVSSVPTAALEEKKGGSHLKKKIKDALEDVQVSAQVTERLLQIVNSGTVAELTQLQCIGKKRAEQIVAWREKAKFNAIEDLRLVGFGEKTLSNFLKRNIYVE